jgi:hypothetical protein
MSTNRKSFLYTVFVCLFLIGCANQIANNDSKPLIHLTKLGNDHPSKKKFEQLLNGYKEEFIEDTLAVSVDTNQQLIQDKFCFHVKSTNDSVLLFFCKNAEDALLVGTTNFSKVENTQAFGTNGAVLFVVKAKDVSRKNSLLSYFAGQE